MNPAFVRQTRFNRFRRGISPIWMEALERRRLLSAEILLVGTAPGGNTDSPPAQIVENAQIAAPVTVVHQFGPKIEGVQAMARQGDKVVAAVYFQNPSADPDLWLLNQIVARFNSDGTLDTSFGTNGVADLGAPIYLTAIATLADGSIVVSGYDGMLAEPQFTIIKLTADGQVDQSFGANGQTTRGTGLGHHQARRILEDASGNIVIVGSSHPYTGPSQRDHADITVVRLTADGAVDQSFNNGQPLVHDTGTRPNMTTESVIDALVRADGGIIVATLVSYRETDDVNDPILFKSLLVAFDAAGNIDQSFGQNGVADLTGSTDFVAGGPMIQSIAQQSDGRIVAVAAEKLGQSATLMRLNADGSVDESFNRSQAYDISPFYKSLSEGDKVFHAIPVLDRGLPLEIGDDDTIRLGVLDTVTQSGSSIPVAGVRVFSADGTPISSSFSTLTAEHEYQATFGSVLLSDGGLMVAGYITDDPRVPGEAPDGIDSIDSFISIYGGAAEQSNEPSEPTEPLTPNEGQPGAPEAPIGESPVREVDNPLTPAEEVAVLSPLSPDRVIDESPSGELANEIDDGELISELK